MNPPDDSEELSLPIQREINAVCDEFEGKLRRGEDVSIESLLDRVPTAGQQALMVELVAIAEEHLRESHSKSDQEFSADDLATAEYSPVSRTHAAKNSDESNSTSKSRFRKLKPHASGGLGEVSLARDEELDREVALKQILGHHAGSSDKVKRFFFEGKITGALEHPGIVPVYALGVDSEGSPFYAMRFIRGETLRKAMQRFHRGEPAATRFRRSNLEFRRLLARLIAVAQTLDYAHSRGVIHRDIKPANIMLGRRGETYVVDWGLARTAGSTAQEPSLDEEYLGSRAYQRDATVQGTVVGTPGFMSPEQALGELDRVGPAADVYSLGACLYFLLTERVTVEVDRSKIGEFINRVATGDFPSVRQIAPMVPRELAAICSKALNPEVSQRYDSAAEFAAELESWLADEPVSALKPTQLDRLARWARRHRDLVLWTGVSLLLVAIISSLVAHRMNQLRNAAELLSEQNREIAESETAARQLADQRYLDARERVDKWLTGYSDALRNLPNTLSLRRRLLEEAAAEYEAFVAEEVDDPTLQFERGLTLLRLGGVRRLLGDPSAALATNEDARLLFLELDKAGNESAAVQAARAAMWQGMAEAELGDYEQASERLETAIRELEPLANDSRSAALELAAALTNQGLVQTTAGNPSKARQSLERSAQLSKSLLDPERLSSHLGYATALVAQGRCLLALGDATEAEKVFATASGVFQSLSTLEPRKVSHLESTAAVAISRAVALRRLGRTASEVDAYQQAITTYQQLVEMEPAAPAYAEGLGMAQTDLGQLYVETGELDAAISILRASTATLQGAVGLSPETPRYREAFAVSLDNLAEGLLRRGKLSEALDAGRGAEAALRPMLAAWPATPTYRQRMSVVVGRRAQALLQLDQKEDGVTAIEQAIRGLEGLEAEQFEGPDARYALAILSGRYADWLWSKGKLAEAADWRQRSTATWNKLLEATSDPAYQAAAAWCMAAAPPQEEKLLNRSLQVANSAVQAMPENPAALAARELASSCEQDKKPAPKSWSRPQQIRWLLAQAASLTRCGMVEEARSAIDEVEPGRLDSCPGDWELAVLSWRLRKELWPDRTPPPLFSTPEKSPQPK